MLKMDQRMKSQKSVKSLLSCVCVRARAQSLSRIRLFVAPWIVTSQAPLPMEFPRQEYWSGLPFPPVGDLPNTRIKPASFAFPALAG